MQSWNFDEQSKLLEIAIQILEDYDIQYWSFGGGTVLSALYYQHRMSYDIDIFLEDYSEIERLVSFQEEIAKNIGITKQQVEASPSAITFILEAQGFGLKLDFVYSPMLTINSHILTSTMGQKNIRVQTVKEIIAKKLKHREKATIRDFVDYAISEERDNILTELKSENIVEMDRYFDMIDKFNSFDEATFDAEMEGLMPNRGLTKKDFHNTINAIMEPHESILIGLDDTGEVVALDEFVEVYRSLYEEIRIYEVYTIPNKGFSYCEVLTMTRDEIRDLSS